MNSLIQCSHADFGYENQDAVVDVTDLKCSAGDPAVFDIDPLYARGFVREYR